MRIKKYHVKGNAYAQLIDDHKYAHYIGPWNADSLCICYNLIGCNVAFNQDKKIRNYLVSRGIESEEDIKSVLNHYSQGFSIAGSSGRLSEKIEAFGVSIDLYDKIVEDYSYLPLPQARKAAKITFQAIPKNQREMMLDKRVTAHLTSPRESTP